MKRKNLQQKVRLLVLGLLAAALLVWFVYFLATQSTVNTVVRMGAQQAALRVADNLQRHLVEIQDLLLNIRRRPDVYDFAAETDPLAYHEQAARIQRYLETQPIGLQYVDSLVVFSGQNAYYRFKGDLGNSAMRWLYGEIAGAAQGATLMVELSGIRYVACTMPLQQGARSVGTVAALVDEGRLRAIMGDVQNYADVILGLVVNDGVVIASDSRWEGLPLEELRRENSLLVQIPGFLPAQIAVGTQQASLERYNAVFAFTVMGIGGIFILLMAAFSRLLNRHFVQPLTHIMLGVQRMGEGGAQTLESCGDEELDLLTGKINEMVWRLDESSQALLQTRLQLQQIEIDRHKAEILSLKKQISAHFTVNTLANIRLLAEEGDMERVGRTCDGLSQLLNYANAGNEHISCMDEFLVLEQYADIMLQRYPGRFTVEFEVDDRLMDVAIPRMLVQPLLENAVVHGVHSTGGHICVDAALQGDAVKITVRDDGAGMDSQTLNALQRELANAQDTDTEISGLEGVALRNIARRLGTWYGRSAQIQIESAPSAGTTATLCLPAQGIG